MGTTPTYNFPYPENADAADGPTQIEALAEAVETVVKGHADATTGVHGIADTAALATETQVEQVGSDLDAHTASTTGVHGIVDTSQLATLADLDGFATEADIGDAVTAHAAQTADVHGIADTSALLTQADIDGLATEAELTAHVDATTNVHGIADTSALATTEDLAGFATSNEVTDAVAAHAADTTQVHGIADTSALETQTGAQAKATTAQTAATTAAATDATSKANAAQAAAISAAATDASSKANAAQAAAIADAVDKYLALAGGTITGNLAVEGALTADGVTDWVNAKAKGAVADGATDDSEALQAGLDSVEPGGVFYMPNGNYGIAAPLVIPPGVTVMMPHANLMLVPGLTDPLCQITLLPTFTGDAALLFLNQDAGAYDGIPAEHRLVNVMVDGSAKTDAPVDGVLATGNIQNIAMHGVTIKKMSGTGIRTAIGTDDRFPYSWRLYHVMSDNNAGHGFDFSVMTDITMFDCQAIGNGLDGFHLMNLANSQMSLCRSEWNTNHGYNFTGDWGEAAGAGALVATACSTDRNNYDGVHIESTGTTPILFNGLMLRRDGRNNGNGGGGFSGFSSVDAETPVVVSALTVYPGVNDDGANTSSPEIGVKIQGDNAVTLNVAVLHAATTPVDVTGGAPNARFGPTIAAFTGPTDAPVAAPSPAWGWTGSAQGAGAAALDNVLETRVTGDTAARSVLRADGVWVLGDGTAAPDTPSWYREQAGNLKVDSYVNMEAGGQAGGAFTSWAAQPKALVAGGGGGGLAVSEGGGATARMGVSTLAAGTVTVANTSVTAATRIQLTRSALGGTPGHLSYTVNAGVGFTITSSSNAETSTVTWLLVEAA